MLYSLNRLLDLTVASCFATLTLKSAATRGLEESQKHLKSHQVQPLSVLQVFSRNHKTRLVRNRHNSIRSGCGPELHLKTGVRFNLLKKGFELLF